MSLLGFSSSIGNERVAYYETEPKKKRLQK